MSATFIISQQAAGYLTEVIEIRMADASIHPEKLAGLHGRKLVDRWRSLQRRYEQQHPKGAAMDADDVAAIEREVIPVYLEVCDALKAGTKSEAVLLTDLQRAAFAKVAALQGATVADTLLACAALWLSSSSGDRPGVTMATLADGVRRYAKRRTAPPNEMYRHCRA